MLSGYLENIIQTAGKRSSGRGHLFRPTLDNTVLPLGAAGVTGLANALNERGIKTGQGSRWHPQTVKRVIEVRA